MKIQVFLINLDGSNDRLSCAHQQLQHAGVIYQRVSAFDGRGKTLDDFPFLDQDRMWSYSGRSLSGGEVGCYLSHVDCAKRFLESDAQVGVVLEDDLQITCNSFLSVLSDAVSHLPQDWHVVNFGNQKNKIFSPRKSFEADACSYLLVDAHYFPMTTTGICWSRQGAEAFLANAFPIFTSVDRFMRYWQTREAKGHCFMPPLVSTTGVDSDIARPAKTKELRLKEKLAYGWKKQLQMLRDKTHAHWHGWRARAGRP
jgi:glycosyl transferase family 25